MVIYCYLHIRSLFLIIRMLRELFLYYANYQLLIIDYYSFLLEYYLAFLHSKYQFYRFDFFPGKLSALDRF